MSRAHYGEHIYLGLFSLCCVLDIRYPKLFLCSFRSSWFVPTMMDSLASYFAIAPLPTLWTVL